MADLAVQCIRLSAAYLSPEGIVFPESGDERVGRVAGEKSPEEHVTDFRLHFMEMSGDVHHTVNVESCIEDNHRLTSRTEGRLQSQQLVGRYFSRSISGALQLFNK